MTRNITKGEIFDPSLIKHIEHAIHEHGIPGFTLSAVKGTESADSHLHWEKQIECWGRRNDRGDAFDPDTLFTIGACSKFPIALCIGMLIDSGCKLPNGTKLSWDTRVRDVLPWWGLGLHREEGHNSGTDIAADATLVDLSGMRTGMPIHLAARKSTDPETALRKQQHLRPRSRLRSQFLYNNENFYALAHIVTVLTGTPFPNWLQTNSWLQAKQPMDTLADGWPMKLDNTRGGPPEPLGWWTDTDGKWLYGGGIATTAEDAALFSRELLDPAILSRPAVDTIFSQITCVPADATFPGLKRPSTYGGGMFHYTHHSGYDVTTHTGGMNGNTQLVVLLPQLHFGLWLYANVDRVIAPGFVKAIEETIIDSITGQHDRDLLSRPVAASPPNPSPPKASYPQIRIDSKTVPVKQLQGVYHDSGYGTISVKPFSSAPKDEVEALALAFRGLGKSFNRSKPILMADLGGIHLQKVIFQHIQGLVFEWTTLSYFRPLPETAKPIAQLVGGPGRAVFVTGPRSGVGMFDGWCDFTGVVRVNASEDDVEMRAETWFEKIEW